MKSILRKLKTWAPPGGWASRVLGAGMLLGLSVPAHAQLSGTYTICASGCNYSTMGGAVSDLNSKGVSGPVTFNVAAGNYNESISINGISGASATNTITFQGNKSNGITRLYSSSTPIYLQYSSYVRFYDMKIEHTSSSYALYAYMTQYCEFKNCWITATSNTGNYAMYLYYSLGNVYENNVIRGGYYFAYQYDGSYSYGKNVWRKNKMTKNNGYYGILSYYGGQNVYEDNYFDSLAQNGYPLYINYEGGTTIRRNTFGINNCYYGIIFQYPNQNGTTNPVNIENNIFNLNASAYYGIYLYAYGMTNVNVNVRHNTIHMNGANGYNLYCYNYSSTGVNVQNNIFSRSGSGACMYHYTGASNKVDGNNFYNTGGTLLYYNTAAYSTLAAYKAAAATNGNGTYDQSVPVTYKSATDLHLDQTVAAPYGPYAGVATDIDGDARCALFPTPGADESSFGKGLSKPKFFGPSTVYIGTPTTFTNSAKQGEPKVHKWYINGNLVTPDSIHLLTTALQGPTDKIKLVTIGCAGKDSFEMTVNVIAPPKAPVTDFLANKNIIKQGEVVRFNDLSTGGPAAWDWTISPAETFDVSGNKVPTYKYIWGSAKTPNNDVKFLQPGKYKVCLTASNVKGKGNTECKTDYIEVMPSINIGDVTSTRFDKGFLFDDGGPNGNYTGYVVRTIMLDPCADSVYLVFKKFDLNCGYSMLRIWEGKDKKGKELTPCTNNRLYGNTTGMTGGPSSTTANCAATCIPDLVKPDTFKASKYMYIEMDASYQGTSPGFEAYWWSKPRTMKKPVAKLDFADSVCTEGSVLFTNASTGDDVSLLWDLDPNEPGFEYNGTKPSSWTYFFPGKYDITLVATNCGGTDTFHKTLKVFDPKTPNANFKADNTTPASNDVVTFSSTSQECVSGYVWTFTSQVDPKAKPEFVNGSSATSANPMAIFPVKGCWDVKLEAKNVSGSAVNSVSCYLNVKDPYCQPSVATLIPDLGISNVSFHTISNATTQGTKEFENFITTKKAAVELGVKYKLTMERTTAKNPMNRSVFVDWNGDGDFDDPQELYAEELNAKTLTWSTDITIPVFANKGATVMRLATNIGTYSNKACGQNEYGEYEDYRLYITDDQTIPVITLKGAKVDSIEQGRTYTDSGAIAIDNLDGNISANIVRTEKTKFNTLIPGVYELYYDVKDKAGNAAARKTRIVTVYADRTKPNMIVEQPETTVVAVGMTAPIPKVLLADDNVDGDVSSSVTVSHNVDFTKVGMYKITYSVTDFTGNNSTVFRYMDVIDSIRPSLTLQGTDTITHEVYSIFNDPGVQMGDNYTSLTYLQDNLVTSGNVDVTKLGDYTINYVLEDESGNKAPMMTRVVKVVDIQKPLLTIKGDTTVKLPVHSKFINEGISISDNYWKNLTTWETEGTFYTNFANGNATKLGSYTVIYKVTDGSGNTARVTRYIDVVDEEAPVGKLKGNSVETICRWSNYVDAGYEWTDNFYTSVNDVTATAEGSFIDQKGEQLEGLYSIRYKLVDKSGNVSYTPYRYILVKSPSEYPCTTIGISEKSDLSKLISVYPNPNNGKFNIRVELPGGERVRISVMNALGQEIAVVTNGVLNGNTFEVDLSTQPSGVYHISVTTNNTSVIKQVVIGR